MGMTETAPAAQGTFMVQRMGAEEGPFTVRRAPITERRTTSFEPTPW